MSLQCTRRLCSRVLSSSRRRSPVAQLPVSTLIIRKHISSSQRCPRDTTRQFHSSPPRSSFTNILADETAPAIQVQSISPERGIELGDGLLIRSACIFLNGTVLLWDVPPLTAATSATKVSSVWEAWTREHFYVFETVLPRPEMLIFGTGARVLLPPPFVRQYLNELGIQFEVMKTRDACSTYNMLSEEGRLVAAALLPLDPSMQWSELKATQA